MKLLKPVSDSKLSLTSDRLDDLLCSSTEDGSNVFCNRCLFRTNGPILFALLFRRVRDKYESELKELEESERKMQEKYNSMKVNAKCSYK